MKFIVCLFLIIVSSGADTDFMCPSTEQWKYRGQICTSDDSYVCLWDEVNYNYAEQCNGPKSERKGFKANINRGNLNRAECSADRYQPVLFTTVGNSDCQLRKSFCIDVGQVKVDNGSSTTDVKCICDYTCGYAFLTMPRDPCFCVPSEEDCSCYRKHCSQGEVLSRDYTCTTNSTDNQHQCLFIPVTSCSTELLLNKGPMNLEEHMGRSNYAAAGITTVLIMVIIIMVIVYWKFQHIKYIVCRKIPFISPLKDLVCIQNEDVTFQCEVSIYIRLKWYKDDKEIDATDPKFVMSSADKCHQLTVTNTQEHDSGVYYIGFKDKRNSAKLDVKVPFISPLKDIICIRDEDATFKCEVSLDNTIVKWYKGDHEIDANDPRFIMLSTGKIHQLTVKQVQDNDKGIYKIGFRDKKYDANLDVRVPFISPLKDIICIRDEDVTFKCEVSLDDITVKWYKGDQEIDANDPRIIMLSTGKMHQLTVKQVQDNDRGLYKIGFRDKIYGANLDVRVPFISPLENVLCVEDEDATFQCEVSLDDITVKWYKDDQEIDIMNSKFIVLSTGKIHQLTVKQVQDNDRGIYKIGWRDKKYGGANLDVRVPFISPLKDIICIQDEDATFKCEVSLDNTVVKWYKGDHEIDSNDPRFIMLSTGKIHQLTVKQVQDNDRGIYKIGFRDKKYDAILDVRVPFISPLEDVICVEDEDATFKCEVSLDNTIVKWYKGDHEIDANDPRIFMLSTGKIHQLTVKQVQDNDRGLYKIGFRDKKYGANLDVRAPFVIRLKDKTCMEHDDVDFICEVSVDGPVKWFKDAIEIDSADDSKFISVKGKSHKLTLKNVQLRDSGIYSAQLRKCKCSSELIVLETVRQEEMNYYRLKTFLKNIAEPVVRLIFDREFNSEILQKTLYLQKHKLFHLRRDKHISHADFSLLFPQTAIYEAEIKMTELKYTWDLENKNSNSFKTLASSIESSITKLYSSVKSLQKVEVIKFRNGSVIVTLELTSKYMYNYDQNRLENTLKEAVNTGSIPPYRTSPENFSFKLCSTEPVNVSSKDFKIRLMIILLKNLADRDIADKLPLPHDISENADLARIKYFRNVIAQNNQNKLSNEEFNEDQWDSLSQAIQRLGGLKYKKECDDMKNFNPSPMDYHQYFKSDLLQAESRSNSVESIHDPKEVFLESRLTTEAKNAVQAIFDNTFSAEELKSALAVEENKKILTRLRSEKEITPSQWDSLFPETGFPSSSTFDIRLMMCLLKNLDTKSQIGNSDVYRSIENLYNLIASPEFDVIGVQQAILNIGGKQIIVPENIHTV